MPLPRKRRPRKRKSPPGWLRRRVILPVWLRVRGPFWKIAKIGTVVGIVGFTALWLTLPSIDKLKIVTKQHSVVITDASGSIIGSYGDTYGEYIPYKDLPRALTDAVVATEDRNFYHHFGVDPLGLIRAFYANMRAHRVVQGGSTITQQLAKNVFLSPERSLWRKAREALLAFKIEAHYSKEDILTIYLNRVYLGAGSFGVDAAAKRYFGKSARDVSLSESAVIAGLLKAPSRFAPTSDTQRSKNRAAQVLVNMEDAGYITPKQLTKATADLTRTMAARKAATQGAMYFADWILSEIPDLIGDTNADLTIKTTIDPAMERAAQAAVQDVLDAKGEKMNASEAALVAMAPDGAVRALIGGDDYGESQYNRATQSKRQPGSAFKMFVYLTAIEGGMTPEDIVDDHPVSVGKWSPKNYSGRYEGEMPLRQALAHSINTVAVQLMERYGRGKVVETAHRLGVESELQPNPSLALGAAEVTLMELTRAYAHLASNGQSVKPYGILEIKGYNGKTLYRRAANDDTRTVIAPENVGMMNAMMQGVLAPGGTGVSANIGRPAAGKTGTTSDYKDAWFMGFTADLITGVWVGNDDNDPMKKVTGGTLPAAIWKQFMTQALAGVPARALPTAGGHNSSTPEGESEEPTVEKSAEDGVELSPSFWDKLLK